MNCWASFGSNARWFAWWLLPERGGGPDGDRSRGLTCTVGRSRFDARDTETGQVSRGRIDATPAAVHGWVKRFKRRDVRVAVEACTGWLFVCDALVAAGAEPHLAEPVEMRALRVASAAPRPTARTPGGCAN